jgi:tetratricopeptide (TPR) repeat protein
LDASQRASETVVKALSIGRDERLSHEDAVRVKALQFMISRDFDRAQPLFEELRSAASERDRPGAYVDLAWLALKREDNPGVIPLLEQALKLNPGHAGAKPRLALAVDRQGKRDRAQTSSRRPKHCLIRPVITTEWWNLFSRELSPLGGPTGRRKSCPSSSAG